MRNAWFRIVSFEVIREISDVAGSAIDYVKAVKSDAVPSAADFPRTIVEVDGPGSVIAVQYLTHCYGNFHAVFDVSFDVQERRDLRAAGPQTGRARRRRSRSSNA